jgi:hypothetical protein
MGFQLDVDERELIECRSVPEVDLDGIAELNDGILEFALFPIFLATGQEGGFLPCGISGAPGGSLKSRAVGTKTLIHKGIAES